MFKDFVIVLPLLLTIVVAVDVNSSSEDPNRLEKTISSFTERRCTANGGEKASVELEKARDILFTTTLLVGWSILVNEGFNKTCISIRSELDTAMISFTDKLEACLDKEEQYLSSLLPYIYNVTMDAFCEDDGKRITDFSDNITDLNYEISDEHFQLFETIVTCLSSSGLIEDLDTPTAVLTKANLCKYFDHGNECILEEIKKNSKKRIQDLYQFHIVNPIRIWCQGGH